jgi:hypothetical protein
MKVGDLVKLRHDGPGNSPRGLIMARHNNPEWDAEWEYTVLWDLPSWNYGDKVWYESEMEVISEAR